MFLAFILGLLAISRPPQDASIAALHFVVESRFIRTPLFTLKAPHIRVGEAGNLVKIQVLARVK